MKEWVLPNGSGSPIAWEAFFLRCNNRLSEIVVADRSKLGSSPADEAR